MNDIILHLVDMPPCVKGQVRPTPEGDYLVFINSIYNHAQQVEIYNHELRHLLLGHYQQDARPVETLEEEANSKTLLLQKIKEASQQGLPLSTAILNAPSPVPAPSAAPPPSVPVCSYYRQQLHRQLRGTLTGLWY